MVFSSVVIACLKINESEERELSVTLEYAEQVV